MRGYAKQDGASRAKPSEMKAGKSRQSKIETLPRRMRAKSAHVTTFDKSSHVTTFDKSAHVKTFVEAEVHRAQTLTQRKSPKLGRVRLLGEDDTPESERNLAVPRTWVRYTQYVPLIYTWQAHPIQDR